MRAVLADAEHPIDSVRGRVVATDGLEAFGREVDLPVSEENVVRRAASTGIDASQLLLRSQVDYRDTFAGAGHERQPAIRRHGDLVRILDRRHTTEDRLRLTGSTMASALASRSRTSSRGDDGVCAEERAAVTMRAPSDMTQ